MMTSFSTPSAPASKIPFPSASGATDPDGMTEADRERDDAAAAEAPRFVPGTLTPRRGVAFLPFTDEVDIDGVRAPGAGLAADTEPSFAVLDLDFAVDFALGFVAAFGFDEDYRRMKSVCVGTC